MKKRLWSVILALAVCLFTLPTQAFATCLEVWYMGGIQIIMDAELTDTAQECRARILEIGGFSADSPINVLLGSSRLVGETTLQALGAEEGSRIDCMAEPSAEIEPGVYVQIFVETLTGKHITLNVRLEDQVKAVKQKIEKKEGVPFERQSLSFNGRELEDGNTLQDYSIQKDSTLHLTLKPAAVQYLDENGQEQTCPGAIAAADSDTQWTAGWYVVSGTVALPQRLTTTGDVHLILADGCTLDASKGGISVSGSLTIYGQSGGTGTLKANGGAEGEAGIAGGTITINGGVVDAEGNGTRGPGISGSAVTINGGRVKGEGHNTGAGISVGPAGTVVINGGDVEARGGGYGAAGIGGDRLNSGGTILIRGGTVMALSAYGGAGIGGGWNGAGGTITISGGTVAATGGAYGAGIGGSLGGAGGTITISGGTVTATGGGNAGAGIGGSSQPGSFSTGDSGNAFIIAKPSIRDESGKAGWHGVIFEGSNGIVYNSPITLTTDAEVPAGATLTIEEGQVLSIGQGVTLSNHGTITNNGTISGGKLINNGTISGDGIVDPSTSHEHSYGSWIVDQAATSATAGSRHRVCSLCGNTQTEAIPATGGTGGNTGGGASGGGNYTPPTYPPTVEKPSGGGGVAAVSPSNPRQGDTVTVTPKPDQGYEVDKITVTDQNGRPVEVTVKLDGTYAFTQPTGRVTIEVTYKLAERPWSSPFTDVIQGDWYYEAVRFVQERGLMNGYSDGRFGANDALSRAQLAQILFNKEGRPATNYQMDFSDVVGEAWYAEAIGWAASQGIVGGYGDGIFGPDESITREQLAVMLWRYSGSPAATNKELRYTDTDKISPFALEGMRWVVEKGVLSGYGDGRLGPQGQATRAEAAQMLKNFMENQEEST